MLNDEAIASCRRCRRCTEALTRDARLDAARRAGTRLSLYAVVI